MGGGLGLRGAGWGVVGGRDAVHDARERLLGESSEVKVEEKGLWGVAVDRGGGRGGMAG